MRFEKTIEIEAPPARVWDTMIDVEHWPEWTESVSTVEVEGAAPIAPATVVRMKQPKLRASVWEVTAVEPGVEFTWKSATPGVTSIGSHRIAKAIGDRVTVSLVLEQTGLFAPIFGLVGGRLVRRYVDMEARGLKQRCEA